MTARAGVWKKKREDLKHRRISLFHRRISLFQRHEKSPNDLHLALEITIIDDQIAACTQQMEREKGMTGSGSSSAAHLAAKQLKT
jgi:hypothetical protein